MHNQTEKKCKERILFIEMCVLIIQMTLFMNMEILKFKTIIKTKNPDNF